MIGYDPWGACVYPGIVELAAPTVEPVSVQDFKDQVRIDLSAEESYANTFLIPAARRHCEQFARAAFISRSFRQDIDGLTFQAATIGGWGPITVRTAPLVSITSIAYYAPGATTLSTWTSTNYIVDSARQPGGFYLARGSVWPAVEPTRPDAVQITSVAGYSSAAENVPAEIRQAILLMGAYLNEHRGDEDKVIDPPRAVKDLLRPTRNFSFV